MPSRRTRQLVPWWTFPIQYLQRAFPTAILSGIWLSSLSVFVPVSIFLSIEICPSVYLPACMPVCQAPILSLFLIHWRIGIWLEIYYCCLVNGDRSGRASDDRERARNCCRWRSDAARRRTAKSVPPSSISRLLTIHRQVDAARGGMSPAAMTASAFTISNSSSAWRDETWGPALITGRRSRWMSNLLEDYALERAPSMNLHRWRAENKPRTNNRFAGQ